MYIFYIRSLLWGFGVCALLAVLVGGTCAVPGHRHRHFIDAFIDHFIDHRPSIIVHQSPISIINHRSSHPPQDRPRPPQDRPKMPQDSFKTTQDCPKTAQDHFKTAPGPPKIAPKAPKRFPRALQPSLSRPTQSQGVRIRTATQQCHLTSGIRATRTWSIDR